ncbi:MAG: GC-type dockerin domain-anchored protein [Phycisphaerales bacterium JB039]
MNGVRGALAAGLFGLSAAAAVAQPCEPGWSGDFSSALLTPEIRALAVFDDDGDGPRAPAVYAGGRFTSLFGPFPDRIGRLQGGRWVDVGAGVDDGAVVALAVFDEDGAGPAAPALFAGGTFSTVGGAAMRGIARWDGTSWSPVGGGLDGSAYSLLAADLDGAGGEPAALYVGGSFALAGGTPVSNLARWDGSAWADVGGGVDDSVHALTTHDDGSGLALIAGGRFEVAGGKITGYVARWDGAAWSRIAGGISGGSSDAVYALASFDGDGPGPLPQTLVAGGKFTIAGGITVRNIAQFDGVSWAPMEGGLADEIRSMRVFDEDGAGPFPARLFIGGSFHQVHYASGAVSGLIQRIVRWDGITWSAVGPQINGGTVYDLIGVDPDGAGPQPSALAAGGTMIFASRPFQEAVILFWDGAQWTEPSGGLSASGHALTVGAVAGAPSASVFVGGEFGSSGGASTSGLALWDGSQFAAVGPPLNGPVRGLAVLDPDGDGPDPVSLLVGGEFTKAGIVNAPRVARWDGTFWWPLGLGADGIVRAFAAYDEDGAGPANPRLFVGGDFAKAGGLATPGIARWDGRNWSALAGDLAAPGAPTVRDLAVFDDGRGTALFVAGYFTTAGGVESAGIARWDGTDWSGLGKGMSIAAGSHRVAALAIYDDGSGPALYAGGRFTMADDVIVNNIAKWDGAAWSALAGGIMGGSTVEVADLAVVDLDGAGPARPVLLAVGSMTSAGGVSVRNLAAWDGASWFGVDRGLDDRVAAVVGLPDRPGFMATGDFLNAGDVASARIAAYLGCDAPCYADCDADGVLDFFDFLCFQTAFALGDPHADCDGDGIIDFFDFLCFQNEFGLGCP